MLFVGSMAVISLTSRVSAVSGSVIASLTNNERTARGLAPMAWNGSLSSSAAMKAHDMCAKAYWAHTGPDGATGWTFMDKAGYIYTDAGENLAKDFSSDAGVVAGWMASPGHKANIANTNFKDIGVAAVSCVFQGTSTIIVVAHYGASANAPKATSVAAPAPAPPKPIQRPAPKAAPTTAQPTAAQQPKQAEPEKPVLAAANIPEAPKADFIVKTGFGSKLWAKTWFMQNKILFSELRA